MKSIAVLNQKGGVGKTTSVANIAAAFAEQGFRTMVMDLDPQANATSGVGVGRDDREENARSYLSALLKGKSVGAFIRETSVRNLAILPSCAEVSDLGVIQQLIAAPAERVRSQIHKSAKDFHYLLIDCPPSLTGTPTIALRLSDGVVVPVQCEYYAI